MTNIVLPAHSDFSSFNNPSRSFDLSNGSFSQIPSQNIPSTMYQTTSQYQTQPFVYGNPSITYTSNNAHSRTSSASSLPRQTPTDASFGLDSNNYSQLNYNRYDQSPSTGGAINSHPDGSKPSPLDLQQTQTSPNMISSGATSTATLSPDSGLKVLPPLSEVFPSSTTLGGQSTNSTVSSPTQTQVVQNVQVQTQQQQSANAAAAAAAVQNGFFQSIQQQYNDATSYTTADGAAYGAAPQNSLMSQAQQQAALNQQSQLASLWLIHVHYQDLVGLPTTTPYWPLTLV
jgi:hypothetical protein